MLLAVDPGTNSPGMALFDDNNVLLKAERFDLSEFAGLPDGQRWLKCGRILGGWVLRECAIHKPELLHVVFERPQWYARGKSKGDPNQLAGIAGVAANLTGFLSVYGPIDVMSPTPAEWIGQLPKTCKTCGANKKKCLACKGSAWNTLRGRYIGARLSEREHALVPDQNDAIDAVGIGLFALGRLKPKRVFSNGRDGR